MPISVFCRFKVVDSPGFINWRVISSSNAMPAEASEALRRLNSIFGDFDTEFGASAFDSSGRRYIRGEGHGVVSVANEPVSIGNDPSVPNVLFQGSSPGFQERHLNYVTMGCDSALAGGQRQTDKQAILDLLDGSNFRGEAAFRLALWGMSPLFPFIAAQPTQVFIHPGDRAFLTASLGNASAIQWYRGAAGITNSPIHQPVASQTDDYYGSDSWLITAPLAASTSYWFQATNEFGSVNSETIQVVITSDPSAGKPGVAALAPVSAIQGQPLQLQASVFGSSPAAIQWMKDGTLLTGETNLLLQIPNAGPSAGGTYFLSASNAYGATTNQVAVVTVGIAPTVTSFPSDLTANGGSNVAFSVAATGTEPLAYQWRKNGTNLVNGGNVSGATTTNLSLSNVQYSDTGTYDVLITSPYGNATSNPASLTVIPQTTQTNYNFATFKISGAVNTYAQGISGSNIVGSYDDESGHSHGFIYAGVNFTILNVPEADDTWADGVSGSNIVGSYSHDDDDESPGFLYNGTIFGNLNAPGALLTSPEGIDGSRVAGFYWLGDFSSHGFVYNGTSYTTLDVPGMDETEICGISDTNIVGACYKNFQWHGFLYNGVNYLMLDVPGANMTRACGMSGGNIVGYYEDSAGYQHGFLYSGDSFITLDVPGTMGTVINGISGNTIVGTCETNGTFLGFMATSVPAVTLPPSITSQPNSQTNAVGTSATFVAAATGAAPLNYQWRKNGTNLFNGSRISGVTTTNLTLTSVQPSDTGNYDLVVTNLYGSTTSHWASLAVITNDETTSTLRDGLLLWLPFDGNASDASGHERNGEVHGGFAAVEDRFAMAGRAYSVSNSYIYVTGLNPDDYTNGFSMGGWIKINDGIPALMGWGPDGAPTTAILYDIGNGTVRFWFGIAGSGIGEYQHQVNDSALNPGNWHHIFVTHSSYDCIYINGQLAGRWQSGGPLGGNSSTMRVGRDQYFGNAFVDDIVVFGRELSANEVQVLYNSGLSNTTNIPSKLEFPIVTEAGFSFNLIAQPSTPFAILVSTDLVNWAIARVVIVPDLGTTNILEEVLPGDRQMFYRAMRQ